MSLAQEHLRHRLQQLQFLAAETNDLLAERLVHDLIVELEEELAISAKGSGEAPGPLS